MTLKLFAKVDSDKLRTIAQELGGIYAEELEDQRLAQFARTLSVYARCELARREQVEP